MIQTFLILSLDQNFSFPWETSMFGCGRKWETLPTNRMNLVSPGLHQNIKPIILLQPSHFISEWWTPGTRTTTLQDHGRVTRNNTGDSPLKSSHLMSIKNISNLARHRFSRRFDQVYAVPPRGRSTSLICSIHLLKWLNLADILQQPSLSTILLRTSNNQVHQGPNTPLRLLCSPSCISRATNWRNYPFIQVLNLRLLKKDNIRLQLLNIFSTAAL